MVLNNNSVASVLLNQEKLNNNLHKLFEQANEIGGILDSLKDSNFAKFSKNSHQQTAFQDMYKMTFYQILQNKQLFSGKTSLRSSIIHSDFRQSVNIEKAPE